MSEWLTVCEFPLGEDLTPVAAFIRRHQLPLRITEERNHQRVSSPVAQLVEPMRKLLQDWHAGRVDLQQITVQMKRVEGEAEPSVIDRDADQSTPPAGEPSVATEASDESAPRPGAAPFSVIPDWPLRSTPVCLVLIALCFIGWFLLRHNLFGPLIIEPQQPGDFTVPDSTLSQQLSRGEFWRLWTPAIVHFSLVHALFNSLGIWILGRTLEARAGSLWFAVLVLLSAPVSNLAQYYVSPENLFGGMSGVVYALVGAIFVIQWWRPGWREVPRSIIWAAIAWYLLCMSGIVDYFLPGGIANAAHLGGLLSGLLLGFLFCIGGGARRYFPDSGPSGNRSAPDSKSF
ncbi:rhomboid family intramembrane serine protease [Microbulbifer sp.]|uniref:rhomboid family intramembrane serine protease n=1 Tax=Microbulbifer sp. TaxID=1908541 RepID=UPI00258AB5BD|nr:rhomboid family intramembrane serine protease [Microbulbifer sp.]